MQNSAEQFRSAIHFSIYQADPDGLAFLDLWRRLVDRQFTDRHCGCVDFTVQAFDNAQRRLWRIDSME